MEAYELEQPAVVGHSLGGMLAGMMAAQGSCSVGVNLDGHGNGRPEHYEGVTAAEVLGYFKRLDEIAGAHLDAFAAPASKEFAGDLVHERVIVEMAVGLPETAAREAAKRALVIAGSTASMRPTRETYAALTAILAAADLTAVWGATRVPLLVVNAIGISDGYPADIGRLHAAYRRGLSNVLADLAHANALLTIRTVDGDHGLVLNQVGETAALVDGFLGPWLRKAGSSE